MQWKAIDTLKRFPLGIKGFVVQTAYGLLLLGLAFVFQLRFFSLLAGFVFSHVYMFLFFYSLALIFMQQRKKLGLILMFVKWLLLFFVLLVVAVFLDGLSFLIGLSAILPFLMLFILKNIKES